MGFMASRLRASQVKKETPQNNLGSLLKKLHNKKNQEQKPNIVSKKIRKDSHPISEMKRILNLPIIMPMDEAERESFNQSILLADKYEEGWRLFPEQANALEAYTEYAGGLFPITVGYGKTLITLMIAAHAYHKQSLRKILLLVPPSVYSQLVNYDIPWARRRVTLALPFIRMGKLTRSKRQALAGSGRIGCYILPYSYLSTTDSTELLEGIKPELIICDEVHYVKNKGVGRTKRLFRFIQEHSPKFVGLSGTITSKSISEYHHIARAALGNNCPLPLSVVMSNEWGAVIDSGTGNMESSYSEPLRPLLRWARKNFRENFPESVGGIRKAFQKRLVTAPGVITSSEQDLKTSLILANREIETKEESEGWQELNGFINQVRDEYITPNGDEIDHAIHAYKWLWELSCGFYNALIWPTADELSDEFEISPGEAADRVSGAKKHHCIKQEYTKELRNFLRDKYIEGCDTPMLVGKNIKKYRAKIVGSRLYEYWKRVRDAKFDNMPERYKIQVRVCPFKIDTAVRWAGLVPKNEGAIIWVYNREMGRWIYEELQRADIDCKQAAAGSSYNDMILNAKNFKKVIVASIKAHGTGKNLQPYVNQFVAQWPRDAKQAEQLLGRVHRKGQTADELVVFSAFSTSFDHEVFAACLNDAIYVQQTTSLRQRLLYAVYDPMPKIFSPEFLRERGMDNKMLGSEGKAMIQDRFGSFTNKE